MIVIIGDKLSKEDIQKAREEYPQYIKITADLKEKIVAIGGEYHSDAEEELVNKHGCLSSNIWGGGYNIELNKFETNAIINLKPEVNDSLEIIDSKIKENFLKIVKEKLSDIEILI